MTHRVAIVGAGSISDFHVAALKAAGMRVTTACARAGSARLRAFSQRHEIPCVYETLQELIDARKEWDALVLAPRVEATVEMLRRTLPLDVPMLVEKPIAMQAATLRPFLGRAGRVIVGYNRRYYATVEAARQEVAARGSVMANMLLPETIPPPGGADDATRLRHYFTNSTHGLDLARYVLGDLRVISAERLQRDGVLDGAVATLRTSRGDILQVLANWNAPANFSLDIFTRGRRLELRPFEAATVYEGMDVVHPTPENPIRTYTPRVVSRVQLAEADRAYKPGFLAQAHALAALIEGRPTAPAATLEDAYEALVMAEAIVGATYTASE